MLNRKFNFDVSFLGSKYGTGDPFSKSYNWKSGAPAHDSALRDEVVAKMREAFGAKFGLFGSGWGEGSKVIPVTESHDIYQRSKIGLSISLDNRLETYTSDRLFRILGCGALLLVKRFPKMNVLGLIHGVNCLIFDTADDAVKIAKSVCAETDDLHGVPGACNWRSASADIAAAGATLALQNHTWSIRIRELQPYIDAVRAARKETP